MGKGLLPGMKTTSRQAFFTVQTLKTTVRRKSVETIVSRSYDEPGMTAAFLPENRIILSKQKGWEIL